MIKPNRKIILQMILMLISAILLSACIKSAGVNVRKSLSEEMPAADSGTNKAVWQSQNPADGDHVEPGSEFDITWKMLNTGTKTWTTDYCVRYFAGVDLTKPGKSHFYLTNPVEPNTVGECSVDAIAPWEPGEYTMIVVLSDENEKNFSKFDITIVVDSLEEQ